MMRKFSALILVLIFAVSFVSSAHAADITLSSAVVINSSNKSQYNGKSIGGTIPASSHAGTSATFYSSAGIVIDGVEINLTIDGLNTDYSELYSTCSGIALRNGAKLHLTVKGTNTLKAGFGGAGIAVPDGCTLEITGSSTGTLNAIGGNSYGGGAGIGSIGDGASGSSESRYMIPQGLGDITINGGTINAQGGTWYFTSAAGGAAGIGSSEYSGAGSATQGNTFSDHRYITNITGSVTINGGNVSATGGFRATGIGGGYIGTLKTINMTGGTVTATGGMWVAAVGCGYNNAHEGLICPEISITGGNLTANGNIGYGGERDTGYSGGKITIGSGVTLKCTGSINPFEASTVPDNSYVDADGNLQQAQNVSSVFGKEDLTAGWWVVDKYTEAGSRIIVTGTVNLILNDGVTLKANKGIQVYKGNTLNIYAQMNGTGKIEAYSVANNSGIGGGYIRDKSGTIKDYSCGTINIYGGTIESHGGESASGIGCGVVQADTTDGGTVNIYGGTVRAWGGNYGAGIGCGFAENPAKYTNLHTVNICGGTVEAVGGNRGAGIGGGDRSSGGNITITGGNVTANSGGWSQGIGQGDNGSGGTVSLSWTNITDSISATSYGGTVTLNKSFMLQGSTTQATTGNIGGKTIVPPVSVSFNANGGSGTMNSVKAAYGYEYTLPECTFTAPNGKTFDKWLVGDVEYEPGGSFDVMADTVVKALWKYGSRTVTFNANGHGTDPTSQTVDYGAKLMEPTVPTAEGWTFGGWYKESSCVNRWEFASETVTENRTLYAKWSEKAYTIIYVLDGGINSANNPLSYMTTENFTLTEPTKTGYTFSGWTYDGQTTPTKNVTINGGTGNKTFTAHWTVNQYTITFDTDGGSEVASVTYNYSADVTAPNATPTCKGRIFDGWENLPSKMPAEDITVNAKWKWLYHYEAREATCMEEGIIDCYYGYGHYYKEIQNGDTYTYERIDDQSSVVTPKTSHNYDNPEWTWFIDNYSGLWVARLKLTCTKDASHVTQTVTADNEVTSAVTTEPTETTEGVMTYTATITLKADDCDIIQDKTFTDTHTEPIPKTAKIAMIGETGYPSLKAALQAVQGGETITLSDDVEENAAVDVGSKSITIDLNGHSATLTSILIQGNLTVKNGTLTCKINNSNTGGDNTLTLDNARLSCEGEYDSDNQSWGMGLEWLAKNIAVTNGSTLSVTGETFLGSGYDDGFSLTIDGTSSIELMGVKFYSYNMARVSAQLSPYLPEGYSIQIDGESGKLMYNNEEAESVTLRGLSTAETVTVTFDSQGGSAVGSQTLNKGTDKAIRPNDPTRDGYNFGGWQLNGTVYDFSTAVTDNITLTATWTAISYTITYNLDGGTVATANPTSYTIETATFTLNNPTKNGSTFAGWTGTGLSGATMTVEIAQGSTGARTYTAIWTGGGSTPETNAPSFKTYQLKLEGRIEVIFYADIPEKFRNSDTIVIFDVSGDKSNNNPRVFDEDFKNDSGSYYGFKCEITSVQMADVITATLNYKDGNETKTTTLKCRAKDYLDYGIEHETDTTTRELLKAIKDYGHYVQPSLAQENGWTVGKEHAEMDCATDETTFDGYISGAQSDVSANYAAEISSNTAGITTTYQLDLKSDTEIYVYVSPASSVSATYLDGSEYSVIQDGRYCVNISGVSAHLLGSPYTVTVKYGDSKEFDIKISALSYVNTVLSNSSDSVIRRAVTSLYRYYTATKAYRQAHGYND